MFADEKCLPGSKFLDSEYCNTCTCSDTGAEACTLKACIEDGEPAALNNWGDFNIFKLFTHCLDEIKDGLLSK